MVNTLDLSRKTDCAPKVAVIDNRGHDFLWMDRKAVVYIAQVIGPGALIVYTACCYFTSGSGKTPPEIMAEFCDMSIEDCAFFLGLLEKHRLLDIPKTGNADPFSYRLINFPPTVNSSYD